MIKLIKQPEQKAPAVFSWVRFLNSALKQVKKEMFFGHNYNCKPVQLYVIMKICMFKNTWRVILYDT